jgi:hypothetical protein
MMPYIKYLLVLITVLFFNTNKALAQNYIFDYNANCISAYKDIMALRLADGNKKIIQESKSNSKNAIPFLLANYADFLELFFNEDASQYAARKQNQKLRLDILDNADENSSYYLHTKALIYFQWALVKLKFKDNYGAALDLRKAYKLLAENKASFPKFEQGDIYMAAIESVVGTIPNSYKWVPKLLGISTNAAKAKMVIDKALQNNEPTQFYDRWFLVLLLKQNILNQASEAWQLAKLLMPDCKQNRMYSFLVANIALNNNHATEALTAITCNETKKEFLQIPFLDYEKANALMYHLDKKAIEVYAKFIGKYKGQFYIKDVYYKMTLLAYINGDVAKAKVYKNKIAISGTAESDADKHAEKFAKQGVEHWPNMLLTKARYLCDGGYLPEAIAVLNSSKANAFIGDDELEYNYRMGRIAEMQGSNASAIMYYNKTIALGKNNTLYFAARAALQAGIIFERLKNNASAINYYKQCLAMPIHDYKNSIDQKAKAALLILD